MSIFKSGSKMKTAKHRPKLIITNLAKMQEKFVYVGLQSFLDKN